jgi:hypothetical protein
MLIAWALLGALIGVTAAQRRGFSVVGGVLGGLLLGPLAFLMFFVSGVSASDQNRKCPFCAEFIKVEAMVCKHCGRELPPPPAAGRDDGREGKLLRCLAEIGGGPPPRR